MARSASRPAPLARRATNELASERLAAYAASLRFTSLPAAVVERAKLCLVDAIGCAVFGRKFPWSTMVLEEAFSTGAGGPCRVPGVIGKMLHVPQAALTMGAFAHAFEFDSLRKPGTGVHPGATVALPAFAMAEAVKARGEDLITAIVAGIEVMFRLGNATLHSPEKLGFHAPGITGPFGAAAACASLMRLSARETANAFGIAGSFAGGLLAFARSGSGGMIKRLHLGRAAESGVVAARLAQRGYEAPRAVIEGPYGVLDAFCAEQDMSLLTKGLGQSFEIETVCYKRYPCHVTAHVPVQLLRGFIAEHRFAAGDIRDIAIEASDKVLSHHDERNPTDIMLAQYSVPFCVALSAYYDPLDPGVFSEIVIRDARVRNLAKRIRLVASDSLKGWGARMKVTLNDGRSFDAGLDTWLGCPETPLSSDQFRMKFDKLTQSASSKLKYSLFDDLMQVQRFSSLEALALA